MSQFARVVFVVALVGWSACSPSGENQAEFVDGGADGGPLCTASTVQTSAVAISPVFLSSRYASMIEAALATAARWDTIARNGGVKTRGVFHPISRSAATATANFYRAMAAHYQALAAGASEQAAAAALRAAARTALLEVGALGGVLLAEAVFAMTAVLGAAVVGVVIIDTTEDMETLLEDWERIMVYQGGCKVTDADLEAAERIAELEEILEGCRGIYGLAQLIYPTPRQDQIIEDYDLDVNKCEEAEVAYRYLTSIHTFILR